MVRNTKAEVAEYLTRLRMDQPDVYKFMQIVERPKKRPLYWNDMCAIASIKAFEQHVIIAKRFDEGTYKTYCALKVLPLPISDAIWAYFKLLQTLG